MARTIHNIVSDENTSVAIVETASSGGGKFAQPAVLSTVRLRNENLDKLFAPRVLGNPAIEVIERWDVDARNQGPASKFGKTLKAMQDELAGYINGMKQMSASSITDVKKLDEYKVELAALKLDHATQQAAGAWSPDPKEADAQFDRRFAEAQAQSQGIEPQRQQATARMRL